MMDRELAHRTALRAVWPRALFALYGQLEAAAGAACVEDLAVVITDASLDGETPTPIEGARVMTRHELRDIAAALAQDCPDHAPALQSIAGRLESCAPHGHVFAFTIIDRCFYFAGAHVESLTTEAIRTFTTG